MHCCCQNKREFTISTAVSQLCDDSLFKRDNEVLLDDTNSCHKNLGPFLNVYMQALQKENYNPILTLYAFSFAYIRE